MDTNGLMAKLYCVLVLQTPSDDVNVEQPGNAIISEWVGSIPLCPLVLVDPGKRWTLVDSRSRKSLKSCRDHGNEL